MGFKSRLAKLVYLYLARLSVFPYRLPAPKNKVYERETTSTNPQMPVLQKTLMRRAKKKLSRERKSFHATSPGVKDEKKKKKK